jgi:hypothetical protein
MTRVKQQKTVRSMDAHAISPTCLFDWETPNRLCCLVCQDHRLLLLLPERRAAMLVLLRKQGQLCGRAQEEAERL